MGLIKAQHRGRKLGIITWYSSFSLWRIRLICLIYVDAGSSLPAEWLGGSDASFSLYTRKLNSVESLLWRQAAFGGTVSPSGSRGKWTRCGTCLSLVAGRSLLGVRGVWGCRRSICSPSLPGGDQHPQVIIIPWVFLTWKVCYSPVHPVISVALYY